MTTVEVSAWADLDGDAVASAAEKDRIVDVLDRNGDTMDVFHAEEWLWEDKSVEVLSNRPALVAARVVAETEKAWLITQNGEVDDPGADDHHTDWVPKSVARRYVAETDGIDTDNQPQAFLKDWES